MKKFIFLLLITFTLFLLFAYSKIFKDQLTYRRSVTANEGSVLVLKNLDLGQVKIVTADTDQIEFELEGDVNSLSALEYEEEGIFTKFGFSEEFTDIAGTITVPEGILLDISLSDASEIQIDSKESSIATDSFLVDTNNLNYLEVDGGELIFNSDHGDDILIQNNEEQSMPDEEGQNDTADCGTGSQVIRDYCCVNENQNPNTPFCEGVGRWGFDNLLRECSFVCDEVIETNQSQNNANETVDCSLSSQSERNSCCTDQHAGEYQGCIGSWTFNNSSQICEFSCYEGDLSELPLDTEGQEEAFEDPISNYCATINDLADRDLCCNDTLKNDLSSGPRPGFPDCIGTWKFDGELGCRFECADRAEMTKILNAIKENIEE